MRYFAVSFGAIFPASESRRSSSGGPSEIPGTGLDSAGAGAGVARAGALGRAPGVRAVGTRSRSGACMPAVSGSSNPSPIERMPSMPPNPPVPGGGGRPLPSSSPLVESSLPSMGSPASWRPPPRVWPAGTRHFGHARAPGASGVPQASQRAVTRTPYRGPRPPVSTESGRTTRRRARRAARAPRSSRRRRPPDLRGRPRPWSRHAWRRRSRAGGRRRAGA